MQTHSSSVVAVKATRALTELLDRDHATVEEYERDLERNVGALKRANPSHASLYNAMEGSSPRLGRARRRSGRQRTHQRGYRRVIDSVESSKDRAAARAVSEIADDDVLLTHDGSSTVLAAIDDAIEAGHSFEVYVTESRPRFLGRKMTRHLSDRDGVDVTLIVDSAAGHFLPEVDRVLVGMDCIVDDTLYNRVGTFRLRRRRRTTTFR